jgi:hypothetical protein
MVEQGKGVRSSSISNLGQTPRSENTIGEDRRPPAEAPTHTAHPMHLYKYKETPTIMCILRYQKKREDGLLRGSEHMTQRFVGSAPG